MSSSSSSLDHAVDEAELEGLIGRERVAEQQDLLHLLHADEPGEEIRAAGIGHQAPGHEHLQEAGAAGGDDEVAGERHVDSHAGGHPIESRNDRFLTIEYAGDEALGGALLTPDQIPSDALGGAVGTLGRALVGAEVGAGAEAAPGAGDHHGPHGRIGGPADRVATSSSALVVTDGVPHIGSIESDPPHRPALFDHESVGGSGRCVDHGRSPCRCEPDLSVS